MPTVRIPTPLRALTGGRGEVVCATGTVSSVVAELEAAHPGLGDRLVGSDGELRRYLNVFVDGEDVRFLRGLDTPVGPDATLDLVPAVAGGADGAPSGWDACGQRTRGHGRTTVSYRGRTCPNDQCPATQVPDPVATR